MGSGGRPTGRGGYHFFSDLFHSHRPADEDITPILEGVQLAISEEMNESLTWVFMKNEVETSLGQMKLLEA